MTTVNKEFKKAHALVKVLLGCSVFWLTGCGGEDGHVLVSADAATVLENRAKWELSAPADFSYTLRRSCFCFPEGPWRIFYADGQFRQWLDLDGDDGEVHPSEIPETIEEMFELLESAYEHDTAEVVVQYHPEYGVPTTIKIDWLPGAEDTGVSYYVTDFALAGFEPDILQALSNPDSAGWPD